MADPKITGISYLQTKLDMSRFCAGSSLMVNVTHINNPKSFYVRPVEITEDDLLLLEDRSGPISIQDLSIAKIVIYKSKVLNKYVRGQILKILYLEPSTLCTLLAIDYGCREANIPLEYIYKSSTVTNCPPLALHCELEFCEPKGNDFDQNALDAMKFFVGNSAARITVSSQGQEKLTVELRTLECPDDVATTLALLHHTTMTKVHNVVNRIDDLPSCSSTASVTYTYKKVKEGEILCVRCLSGDSFEQFYVAEIQDIANVIKNGFEFTEYCKRQKLADVDAAAIDGRCCGAKISSSTKYERAIVKQVTVPGEKALVKFVDWGREEVVKFAEIKTVTSDMYTTPPAVAMYCTASNITTGFLHKHHPTTYHKFLYQGHELKIKIEKAGNGVDIPHDIDLYNVDQK